MIEAEHLSKIYGSTPAIQDVDFSVEDGEILGFLGPNGAGKTTTMRILSGYLPATTGTARIAGYDVHEQSMQVRQRIGYLPEIPPLYDEMTVQGFLSFVARIKGVSAGDRSNQVNWAIQRCNLQEKHNILIRKLSKGFRQRVGIAQAIVHNPPVIILDEPTVGLDPRQIIEVRNLIKSLAGEHTIILSTHILPEVSMTCDRVTIINQGNVVATNTPDNLMAQLSATSGYELDVEGNANLVQPLLQVIPGVRSADVIPQNGKNRYKIRVNTEPNGPELGRNIASLVVKETGLGLYEMRRTRPSLEDVFLELTTEEASLDPEEHPSDTDSPSPTTDNASLSSTPEAANLASPNSSSNQNTNSASENQPPKTDS
ncbi:MAG: ABC transporter ATP-binding protein [Kamptonema sp. SIO4C4]|nr:ABC transporter ATP-binding protein [Kamptonema sp. SIO4C4]